MVCCNSSDGEAKGSTNAIACDEMQLRRVGSESPTAPLSVVVWFPAVPGCKLQVRGASWSRLDSPPGPGLAQLGLECNS